MPELTEEAKRELRDYLKEYLRGRVLALIGLIGLSALGSLALAGWEGARRAAARIADDPSAIARELAVNPEYAQKIGEKVAALPVGTIVPFAGEWTAAAKKELEKAGWFLCDGSVLSRTEHDQLFSAIGSSWGAPDDRSFNLPDLRGQFLRGADLESGVDIGADKRQPLKKGGSASGVGSLQQAATAKPSSDFVTGENSVHHTHSYEVYAGNFDATQGAAAALFKHKFIENRLSSEESQTHTHTVTGGGDPETRPVNVATIWLVKVR